MMKQWLLLLFMLLLVSHAWAASDFYVAPSGGSDSPNSCSNSASPCATVAYAITKLTAGAGDTLWLRGGNHASGIRFVDVAIPNGNSWPTATLIRSYPDEIAVVPEVTFWMNSGAFEMKYFIVDRIKVDPNFSAKNFAIYATSANVHHIRFQYGEITRTGVSGVQFYGNAHHNEIIHSEIHHCGSLPDKDHGFYGDYQNDTIIAYNKIHHNSSIGIQFWTNSGNSNSNTQVYNNEIYNNGYGAVHLSYGNNTQIYNNVMYQNGNGPSNCCGGGIEVIYGSPTATKIWNNTIADNNGSCVKLGGASYSSTAINPVVQNNICRNNTGGIATDGETVVSSPTYTKNLCDSVGIGGCTDVGNPFFLDSAAGNYHLTASSAAKNVGVTIASFDVDKDLLHRPQGSAWDIGAYEYPEATAPISGNPIYVAQATGLDSWNCTDAEDPAKAKLTLASACTCMTVPGKTMFIKAGTYNEKWDTLTCPITGGNGPSFSDATIVTGFASDVVVIQLPSGVTETPAFFLSNGVNDKYTIYRNLIIDANNQVGSNGIALYPNVHHIRFENVEVKNTLNGYETIYLLSPNNIGFYDSYIHHSQLDGVAIDGTTSDITFQRTRIKTNSGKGLHLIPGRTITNLTVRECDISSNILDAIDFESGDTILLANNRIYSNGGKGIVVRASVTNVKMYFQSITGNATYGIDCAAGASGNEIVNVISYNNSSGNILNSCSAAATTNFVTNPLFTNAATGDLTLQDSSGAIDIGTPIPGISNDYAGLPRPQGATDIGSEERAKVPVGPGSDVTVLRRLLYQTGMFY